MRLGRTTRSKPEPFTGDIEDNRHILRRLIFLGLITDGAHHKQWYLEQLAKEVKFINVPDHEPGVAP